MTPWSSLTWWCRGKWLSFYTNTCTCSRVQCAHTHIPSNQFWQAGPVRNLGATWGQENLLQRPWVYFLLVGQWLPAGWSETKSNWSRKSVENQVIISEVEKIMKPRKFGLFKIQLKVMFKKNTGEELSEIDLEMLIRQNVLVHHETNYLVLKWRE